MSTKPPAVTMPHEEIRKLLVRESGGRLFAVRKVMLLDAAGNAECPICGKRTDLYWGSDAKNNWHDPRGYGFRKASFSRHVGGCRRRYLAAIGLQDGRYDESQDAHPLIPLP